GPVRAREVGVRAAVGTRVLDRAVPGADSLAHPAHDGALAGAHRGARAGLARERGAQPAHRAGHKALLPRAREDPRGPARPRAHERAGRTRRAHGHARRDRTGQRWRGRRAMNFPFALPDLAGAQAALGPIWALSITGMVIMLASLGRPRPRSNVAPLL